MNPKPKLNPAICARSWDACAHETGHARGACLAHATRYVGTASETGASDWYGRCEGRSYVCVRDCPEEPREFVARPRDHAAFVLAVLVALMLIRRWTR